jgi:hypothetical protein
MKAIWVCSGKWVGLNGPVPCDHKCEVKVMNAGEGTVEKGGVFGPDDCILFGTCKGPDKFGGLPEWKLVKKVR